MVMTCPLVADRADFTCPSRGFVAEVRLPRTFVPESSVSIEAPNRAALNWKEVKNF